MLKRLSKPSPATVLAFIAVFAAFTGGAYGARLITSAKIKNATIKSIDVKNNNLTGTDLGANSVKGTDVDESSLDLDLVSTESVQVDTTCTIQRQVPAGTGATSNDPNGGTEGQCDVTFTHDVSACAYQVSLTRHTTAGTYNGEITAEPLATTGVVRVYGFLSGAPDDRPFALTVLC